MKKYTEDMLIMMLRKKAKELGRTPKSREVTADPKMPIALTYQNTFGSWNAALVAAGLIPLETRWQSQKWSKKTLVSSLQKLARTLGQTPKITDLKEDLTMPPVSVYLRAFGTWNKALETAGLRYSEEEMISMLQEKAEELGGRAPIPEEMEGMPSQGMYASTFGAWSKALRRAGIDVSGRIRHHYSREKLVLLLQEKAKELGRRPGIGDIESDPEMPSFRAYRTAFGTLTEALEAAELK